MKKLKSKQLNLSKLKIAKLNFTEAINGGTGTATTDCTNSEKCTEGCHTHTCSINPTKCETDGSAQGSSFVCTN